MKLQEYALVRGCSSNSQITRVCTSSGLLMKFKTLFMSDEEKHGHYFCLLSSFLICDMSKQFLAPEGLSAALCVFKLI